MIKSFLYTASLSLFWLFSPDSLVIAANSAGITGWIFPLLFLLALLIASWAAHTSWAFVNQISPGEHSSNTDSKYSPLPSTVQLALTISACLGLVMFLPTGALVTAGFTFNETFLYWFPNFGFSFILLTIILFAHWVSLKFVIALQAFFFTCTVGCILFLALFGLAKDPAIVVPSAEVVTSVESHEGAGFGSLLVFCSLQLLFLGYDQNSSVSPALKNKMIVLLPGGLIMCLWCVASLLHVEHDKLADSTIPYILGAREIVGQTGRVIMGIAVVSGTCCVVNGLFIYTRSIIGQQLTSFLSHDSPLSQMMGQRIYVTAVSICIGLCMALGLAGEDILETYIFGSLLLWLLLMAHKLFAGISQQLQTEQRRSGFQFFLPTLLTFSVLYLVVNYHDPRTLLFFFAVALTGSSLFTAGWVLYSRKINQQPNNFQGDAL